MFDFTAVFPGPDDFEGTFGAWFRTDTSAPPEDQQPGAVSSFQASSGASGTGPLPLTRAPGVPSPADVAPASRLGTAPSNHNHFMTQSVPLTPLTTQQPPLSSAPPQSATPVVGSASAASGFDMDQIEISGFDEFTTLFCGDFGGDPDVGAWFSTIANAETR